MFKGTIIANNGAINLNNSVSIDGRAFTTSGAINTSSITTLMLPDCSSSISGIESEIINNALTFTPNPFNSTTNLIVNNPSDLKNCKLMIFNVMGKEVINTTLNNQLTTIKTNDLSSGIYFYKVMANDKIVQSGKLISQQ